MTTYYQSTHPSVAEYQAEAQKRLDSYRERVLALGAEFPGFEIVEVRSCKSRRAAGLSGDALPGPEWKKRKGDWYYTPVRATRAGRVLSDRFKVVSFSGGRIPGMPNDVFVPAESMMYSPGLEYLGGVFYSFTQAPAELVEADGFDPSIWQRVNASVYHLAKEAETK